MPGVQAPSATYPSTAQFVIALAAWTTFASPAAAGDEHFREKVAPTFERHCVRCHQGDNPKGEFSLTTETLFKQGGESGAVVEPGKPEESTLIEVISGEKPAMPKQGVPLTAGQVADIRQWIADGAEWPANLTLRDRRFEGSTWWSLQPLVSPPVPAVPSGWVRTPIDAFILEKLQAEGLTPSPDADKRTLLRRLKFDLHGLPPTPAELDAFLADESPRAYDDLVDRLLAAPQYGERWGRHWLDVVHFGESHGYDKDKPRPNAWPYRDYVIAALNSDKPYSRFVEEQLAGDVLFPQDPQGIVATGFIAAGPWDFVGHVELREGTTDKLIARSNDRDDMVASTMSTFVSLTVHCARCHDHKFDPISQAAYYRLQAVFAGVDRADRPYPKDPALFAHRQTLEAERQKTSARLTELQAAAAKQLTPAVRELDARLTALDARLTPVPAPTAGTPSPSLGYHSLICAQPDVTKWVQVDLGESRPIEQVILIPAHVKYGTHPGPGFGFPVRFRVDVSDQADFAQASVLADYTGADFRHPGDSPVGIAGKKLAGRYVRVTATKLGERTNDWIFALSELVVTSQGQNVAAGRDVTALDSIEAGAAWAKKNLVDGFTSTSSLAGLATSQPSPSNGYHSGIVPQAVSEKWVQVDLGTAQPIDEVRLIPARPTDFADSPGFGFPVRYRVEAANTADFSDRRVLANHTAQPFPNPGEQPATIDGKQESARYVRITATELWKRSNDHVFALAELEVRSQGKNIASTAKVTALDSIEQGLWSTRYLVDGFSSRTKLGTPLDVLASLSERLTLQTERDQLADARQRLLVAQLPAELRRELDEVGSRVKELEAQLKALPPAEAMVYGAAAVNGGKSPALPRPVHFLHRGNVKTPGELMPAGTVDCVPGLEGVFALANPDDAGGRRAALAKWITDPQNVLMRRSIVNRVWHYHFGRGLVETPNDFGHMGALPSHPALLDWLAAWFQADGESLKRLHRLIVLSSVYRQTSAANPQAEQTDSGNRYLWRMNRSRLDAEAIRDSVLQVTGKLDLTVGGPSVQQFYFKNDHSPIYDYERFDVDDPGSFRRGVYRFIVRSVPDPFMDCLDCADPSILTPKRNTTLTAIQALALLNNKFMVRQAEHFAERVQHQSPDPAGQIAAAYRLALSRDPRPEESALLVEYAATHGLANACRVILNSNEFIFVD